DRSLFGKVLLARAVFVFVVGIRELQSDVEARTLGGDIVEGIDPILAGLRRRCGRFERVLGIHTTVARRDDRYSWVAIDRCRGIYLRQIERTACDDLLEQPRFAVDDGLAAFEQAPVAIRRERLTVRRAPN